MKPVKNLMIKYFLESQGAVAEVLDFITLAGILIVSLSLIGLAGYPILRSAQETRYLENTRLSFIVLADNINKIALGQALSQSVELKMYGGPLSVTGNSSIKINATNSSNKEIILYDQSMRSIENHIGDSVVAYEGTGVWIKYPNGVVLNAYKPLIADQNSTLIIPVISIAGVSSTAGNSMSRVRAEGYTFVTFYNNVSNIKVTINSSYIDGWKNYYKKISWENCSSSSDCTIQLQKSNIDIYILGGKMDVEII